MGFQGNTMTIKKSKLALAVGFALTFVGLGIGQFKRQQEANAATNTVQAPTFQVDPFWPKPLPNHWILGNVIGVAIDSRDHVYIVHRDQDSIFRGATEIGLKMG